MWLVIVLLLVAGLLSVSSFVISKKPESKEMFDKMVPYAGWVGVVLLLVGLYHFFGIGSENFAWWEWFDLLDYVNIVFFLTAILYSPIAILLGFMQGYALIDKYVLNKAKDSGGSAGAKFDKAGDKAYEKIMKVSTPVGFIGIVLALLLLLYKLEILGIA